jgi:tetratricopeptide (TPR) repeat protein
MEEDDYGFCFEIEKRAVEAFDRRGLAAFEEAVRSRFDSAPSPEPGANREADYERRRRANMLKTVYARQRNVDAYLGVCGDELTPRDCEVVAEIHKKRRKPEEALSWVERGIELESKGGTGASSAWGLSETRRGLLKKLGRGAEALDSAWKEFRTHPSEDTYETLMRYVPKAERKEWRARAMEASEKGDLYSLIGLWLKTKEIKRLVNRLRRASRESLENMSHYATEPAAKRLEKDHPDMAAKLYMALGLRIVDAKKSKYYDAAISHFEKARRCCERAGLEDEWKKLVDSVHRKHHRKYGFMPGFERVVEGRAKEREPTFLERARRRWPRRGSR